MEKAGRVAGKVAVVTGAAKGIGRACARRLALEGARVAITDVLDDRGQAAAEEIRAEGGEARYWHLDVRSEAEIVQVLGEIKAELGNVTVLVNNAGIGGGSKPTHEFSSEDWDAVMSVNVKGVFLVTKYTLPQMLEAGHGSIVNMSSIYGLVGAADAPAYRASKGAVRLMTKTDAMLYAARKIRVNSVHPGFIWTDLVDHALDEGGHREQKLAMANLLHPIGHLGDPDDVAYGVLYLASDESKFVTGSELVIDGGYTAR
jgi:NAD(P)-dependent dehydrogenase (short-subunit alcohol dehydrogenase family)